MKRAAEWVRLAVLAGVTACGSPVWASATAAWEMNTYTDFVKGRFQGVSLTRDGRLMLAPRLDTVFSTDQQVIWSVARASDGTLYAATGHRGRVYRIDPNGRGALLWTAPQPEVFVVALGAGGVLYAASSPDGCIYRIQSGTATEYFNPQSRYIWSLAVAPDGVLYAGTGDQGKVFRITAAGQGEVYYETGQSHVTSLALDPQGRLLAGTEPNGILYRVSAKDKAFALYDASLPEIRAIVPAPDGTIYAAALGGSLAKRLQGASQAAQAGFGGGAVPAVTTSITVEANAQAGPDIKPPQPDAARQAAAAAAAPATQVTTQFTPAMDLAGVEKSAVYKINPDNTVETLWSSKEENAYDLLRVQDRLLISTDDGGRVYSIAPDRKVTLIVQTNEGEATRLVTAGGAVLAATGNMARIYRLSDAAAAGGSYESPVYDAGSAARWGSLSWRGQATGGATIRFQTRSGNSVRPDRSWSDWSGPLTDPAGSRVDSPNARYVQWRVELAGGAAAAPVIDTVTLAYLSQNTPPVIRAVNVTTQTAAGQAGSKAAATSSANTPYSITVTDTGDASVATASGTPTTVLARSVTPQISITWQAEDPDGDRLVYAVYFRGEEESEWKLLKANLHDASLSFDGDALADGKYYFRVVASDREVNPPATARTAELTSAPVLIDNTPPVISIGPVRRTGTTVTLVFEAVDNASPLRRCEYSLDAAGWVPVEAADGVIDSQREKFVLEIPNVPPGEHLVVLRAVDSSNNAGLAKVVLR